MSQSLGTAARTTLATPPGRARVRDELRRGDIEQAVRQFNVGDLAGASRVLAQVLEADPQSADALHLLGVIAAQRGDAEEGVRLIQRALASRPNDAVLSNNLAGLLLTLDRAADAVDAIIPALALNPNHAALHYNLGNAQRRLGNSAAARDAYRHALTTNPGFQEAAINLVATLLERGETAKAERVARNAHARTPQSFALRLTLGSVLASTQRHQEALPHLEAAAIAGLGDARHRLGRSLLALGRAAEARRALERALADNPSSADIRCDLGATLLALDSVDAAIRLLRETLARAPHHADAESNLCEALRRAGSLDDAIQAGERATTRAPLSAGAWLNHGAAMLDAGMASEARAAIARALALEPSSARAENAYGSALEAEGDAAAALVAYDRALALDPRFHEARLNRALAELKQGDYRNGWADYEARRKLKSFPAVPRDAAEWHGETFRTSTLLLFTEQGYGDTLQFVRFAPLVAAKGGKVILACQRALVSLLEGGPGLSQVVPIDGPLPSHDLIAPLMSTPFRLGLTLEALPKSVPYVAPPPPMAVEASKDQLRIGIAWAGSVANRINRRRSCPLIALAPLADRNDATLYSLQAGSEAGALKHLPFGDRVVDLTPRLEDFRDTASAMMALDLIITIDTATAHLAGALGRPAWVMLSAGGDWRYLEGRPDSPWYPSMRLFRQSTPGDWDGVIREINRALDALPRK
ncbi:MAG: tetratricopeptide repeat protein [Alphaproteobacteria bacterium]|nr:tetratricopeptide repeat protein [Alphaproteobacteria bacterium]